MNTSVPRETHSQDEHCAVDPETGACSVCGVGHFGDCQHCDGHGFHRLHCPVYLAEIEDDRAVTPSQLAPVAAPLFTYDDEGHPV